MNSTSYSSSHFGVIAGKVLGFLGLLILGLSFFNIFPLPTSTLLTLSITSIASGVLIYAWGFYSPKPEGIKNNHVWFKGLTSRGLGAYISGALITAFYVLLYWYPSLLGLGGDQQANSGLVALFDPLSQFLKGQPASQWFVYGTLYTLAIIIFGIKFIWKYRHNRYQIVRTISVMFFQTGFAFILPEILIKLNQPYNDFKNMWPLNYYFFDEWNIKSLIESGGFGLFMILFGIAMIFIVSPVLTYFYGKRWYCSWVCGCGGLAETAGDPFRQLSDKSIKAWKVERWIIHSVLLFSIIMTVAVIYSYLHSNPNGYWVGPGFIISLTSIICLSFVAFIWFRKDVKKEISQNIRYVISGIGIIIPVVLFIAYLTGSSSALFIDGYKLRSTYGFLIGAAFSGVIGVGFYPLLGSRVWCRFGCPMAAILGLQQKWFSRFRITTNGSQCISCGNCSTYCEMGIDVRAYAQKGQNIVRSSCVGCGICAAVCPRGVLKLENGSVDLTSKTEKLKAIHISENDIRLLD